MNQQTKITLERPKPGALGISLHMPALAAYVAGFNLPAGQDARIISDVFQLVSVGTHEIASQDTLLLLAMVHWLSRKSPRTKFEIRGVPDTDTRWAYDFANGRVAEHDPRPPAKKASKDVALALQQATAAKSYSASGRFAVGELLEHPTFGRGLVTKFFDNKIVVQFRDAERTLIHARA